jgi:hypothetical protein
MATPDNGACAVLYSASEARLRVGDGSTVTISETTRYPFEEQVQFTLAMDQPVNFPLYLRIPSWCDSASLSINGKRQKLSPVPGKFVRVERQWKPRDRVTLNLPMKISVRRWARNHNSASVNYGPLTFSLKIGERYDRFDSSKTAIGDSNWQEAADPSKWPAFEIQPTTAWNYALQLDSQRPEASFKLRRLSWPADDFPFTTQSAPIEMEVEARQVPQWTLDRTGLCGELQDSPVRTSEPLRKVTLVPMGAARLRISAFPVVGTGAEAHDWSLPGEVQGKR